MTKGQNYSYLDLSVHPELSGCVLSADATVLFSNDLHSIYWANAAGARLFGGRGVVELLDANLSDSQTFVRQLQDAVTQMEGKEPIVRGFRISQGLRAALLQFEIIPVTFADGNTCYKVTQRNASGGKAEAEHFVAGEVVESLEGFADAAAILDDYGLPLAASKSFGRLGPSEDDLQTLVTELADESDSLIKRPVTGANGKTVVAGLGRISSHPGRNLIVLARSDEPSQERPSDDDGLTLIDQDDLTSDAAGLADPTPTEPEDLENRTPAPIQQPDPIPEEVPVDNAIEEEELTENDLDFPETGFSQPYPPDEPDTKTGKKEIPAEFRFTPTENPVRFAWSVDENTVFTDVSPELSETVGPHAADIVGRSWEEVSRVFGFDSGGEISSLLSKHDTWSGKTVLWPVQETDMVVPVDLAALPAFGAAREFEGFKGFGTIRTTDALVDPEETGMALIGSNPLDANLQDDHDLDKSSANVEETVGDDEDSSLWFDDESEDNEPRIRVATSIESDEDGTPSDNVTDIDDPKIVKLVPKHRNDTGDLSKHESEAFKTIGNRLREGPGGQSNKVTRETSKPDTSLIENLPVAVMIYRDGEVLFANEKLLQSLNYNDIEEINLCGGVDAVLKPAAESEHELKTPGPYIIHTADDQALDISPVLHTVHWDREKALQLSFTPPAYVELEQPDVLEMTQASEIQSILDTTSDGIILLKDDGEIISINAAAEALFNRSFDEATGKHLTSLFATTSHGEINQYINALAEPGVASLMEEGKEVIAEETNGGQFPVFVTIAKLESTGKLCAVIQDLTSWKKTEQDLIKSRRDAERASEQKSDFLAQVSHEIRTPLNAIIGFSDIMIEERFGPIENSRYREYLLDINRSGNHVLDLVNDLLDLSKIESGKLDLTFDAVDINKSITETVALLQPQANANRIIIRTSLSRAVPKVVADERTILQIILNLVTNAIKYSPPNSQVIVSSVYESSGEVALRVRDAGDGMNERELADALKPYHQVSKTSDQTTEGTGLGLPLTKALVEANRAIFDLESEPGQGTIAHVQFPSQRVLAE